MPLTRFPKGVAVGLAPVMTVPQTSIPTDANVTYTAAQLLGGYILRSLVATARSDTTDTAAAIIAAMGGNLRDGGQSSVQVGDSFYLEIVRTDAALVNLTLLAGAGVTISGTAIIPNSTSMSFLAVVTNASAGAEAITLYNLDPVSQALAPQVTPVNTDATDANITWTVAYMLGGLLRRTITAARSDTTPTAAAIVAALPRRVANASFYFDVARTDAAAFNLTVLAGAGVTLVGTMTIPATTTRAFLVVATNVGAGTEAVTVYSLGSSAT